MQRISITKRNNWEEKIKEQGFLYYKDYYSEDAAYEFSSREIDQIDIATAKIFEMCLEVVQYVIDHKLYDKFFIPPAYTDLVEWSWKEDMMSFYGRMDLGYDGTQIKLLEFNADTPTGLFETSVIQWYWLQDYQNKFDQFNSIHEKLIDHLKVCKPFFHAGKLYFSCVQDSMEDFVTVKYLEDIAEQAGIPHDFIYMEDVSLNNRNQFCTKDGTLIENIFKLYPYEWMFHEQFGPFLPATREECYWVEPAYKSLLSNKMLLVYLHQLFPDSPYLLPTYYGKPPSDNYVKKPVFSREGANVSIFQQGKLIESTDGDYGEEGFVYQQYMDIPRFNGKTPVLGSWLIGGNTAGMGIRESDGRITNNMSRFVPHYFF